MTDDELNRAAAERIKGWKYVMNEAGIKAFGHWDTGAEDPDDPGVNVVVHSYSPATSNRDSAELFLGMPEGQRYEALRVLARPIENKDDHRQADVALATAMFDPRKLTEACLAAIEG